MQNQNFQFERLKNEGKRLLRLGYAIKSIKYFTMALAIKSNHVECYICRSIANLTQGFIEKALADANEAIKLEPNNWKAIKQIAEVHYHRSEFEKALLWYHRGFEIRSHDDTFSSGIDRARFAMNNCMGKNSSLNIVDQKVHSDPTSDRYMKSLTDTVIDGEKEINTKDAEATDFLRETKVDRQFIVNMLFEERKRIAKYKESHRFYRPNQDSRANQKKTFFNCLTYYRGFKSPAICEEAKKCVQYLDPRSVFWMHRSNFKDRMKRGISIIKIGDDEEVSDDTRPWDLQIIVMEIVRAEMLEFQDEDELVIDIVDALVEHLDKVISTKSPLYNGILSDLYSIMGCCHLKLGQYEDALDCHEIDLSIGTKNNIPEAISRSLDYIGLTLYNLKKYDEAIEVLKDKLSKSKGFLEQCWLSHRIGKCYLALDKNNEALASAQFAFDKAVEGMDEKWQMNCNILIGNAQENLEKYDESCESYIKAVELANDMKLPKVKIELEKLIASVLMQSKKDKSNPFEEQKPKPILFLKK